MYLFSIFIFKRGDRICFKGIFVCRRNFSCSRMNILFKLELLKIKLKNIKSLYYC